MKRKHWVCVYCDKKYYTTCQICPSCRRIMQLEKNVGYKRILMEGKNDSERV